VVVLVVAGCNLMGYKASKIGNDDAIIVQKKYFNMSLQFNHDCKGTNKRAKNQINLEFFDFFSYLCKQKEI